MASWWTGKLGDFVWLIFAPFVFALIVSWIVPKHLPNQEQIVGLTAFGFIGVWFAAAKTISQVYEPTIALLDSIAGWHGTLRMDASDLITLPGLIVGWYVWLNASNNAPARPLAWIALVLGAMGTVATSCVPPNLGITWLCEQGNGLYATSLQQSLVSRDGGLTWQEADAADGLVIYECMQSRQSRPGYENRWSLTDGAQQYRFVQGEAIYVTQAGQPETLVFDLTSLNHDTNKKSRVPRNFTILCGGPNAYVPGPFDAVIDSQTGNLVVAMGHDGVLVKTVNSEWHWVPVGDYQHIGLDDLDTLIDVIRPELMFALALLILIPPTIALPSYSPRWYEMAGLILIWLIWLGILLLRINLDDVVYFTMPLLIIGLMLTVHVLERYINQRRQYLAAAMLVVLTFSIALLFLLPYALWVRRTMPNHGTASSFAFILVGAGVISAGQYFRYRFPSRKKKKKHDDLGNQKPKHTEYTEISD